MTKTNNYELNIVEGSDKVNPLVVDNPNYEKIDEVMKKNADSAISTATELKTGTVHALTRVNSDCPVFRFVATSLFTTGDTFTVDGVQVTALLTDGTPLVTGCYVIGANVLCCLTGTTLSVYVAQNLSGMTAYNSERLGGHDADYFGTAEAVATAQQTAENANTISLSNQEKIKSCVLYPDYANKKIQKTVEQNLRYTFTEDTWFNLSISNNASNDSYSLNIDERTVLLGFKQGNVYMTPVMLAKSGTYIELSTSTKGTVELLVYPLAK